MKLKRNRVIRNRKGCGIKTNIRSIRAEDEFWEMCTKTCEIEKTTRNELIVRVVSKYCKKLLDKHSVL